MKRAATTPPIAPNRWPCHETPGRGHERERQRRAVDREHEQADHEVQRPAAEDAARDQVGGEAEHDAAGADVVRVRRREHPRAETRHERHDHGHRRRAGEPAERDREAEHQERDRVADQVRPARVQERRERDPRQPVDIPRVDAVVVEVRAERVEGLDHPHHHDHPGHEREPADAVLGGGRAGRWLARCQNSPPPPGSGGMCAVFGMASRTGSGIGASCSGGITRTGSPRCSRRWGRS